VTTLVIDRCILPESLATLFRTPRVKVQQQLDGGDATFSPVIDPNDYDNATDYLSAIPGMMESINDGIDAPESECDDMPDDWFDDV